MDRESAVTFGLVVVGALLMTVPFAVPAADVRVHDTSVEVNTQNESALREANATIISYENLSKEGRTTYERALENGGTSRTAVGAGPDDWQYPSLVVIERPTDGELPPADERDPNARYDAMQVSTGRPPITSTARLGRIAAFAVGLCCVLGAVYNYLSP